MSIQYVDMTVTALQVDEFLSFENSTYIDTLMVKFFWGF